MPEFVEILISTLEGFIGSSHRSYVPLIEDIGRGLVLIVIVSFIISLQIFDVILFISIFVGFVDTNDKVS